MREQNACQSLMASIIRIALRFERCANWIGKSLLVVHSPQAYRNFHSAGPGL
jgi:hypothetical protein